MKNSIYIIGNLTRDLPACSAVSQLTAPPRAQTLYLLTKDLFIYLFMAYLTTLPVAKLFYIESRTFVILLVFPSYALISKYF